MLIGDIRSIKLALSLLICHSLLSCVFIPSGTSVQSEKELTKETVENRKLLSSKLLRSPVSNNELLSVKLEGDYLIKTWDIGNVETVFNDKYVIIGAAPGLFANIIGDNKLSGKQYVGWPFGTAIVNGILVGIPTIVSWFLEIDADWSAPTIDSKHKDRETTLYSLVGWSKTGTTYEKTFTTISSFKKVNARDPFKHHTVSLSIPKIDFNAMGKTDEKGW